MSCLKVFAGKKRLQKFYEMLYLKALTGMNYGGGALVKDSGELETMKIINQKVNHEEPIVIFDVGANIGLYSKNLYDIFGSKAIIHSFEPSEKIFKSLSETTSQIPGIVLNNFGLGDKDCSTILYSDSKVSGTASVYQRNLEHFGSSFENTEEIKLSTIDEYCKNNSIDRIHFLKLDIEGNELNALKGAERMINEKRIDFIQFEFGGCNIDSKTYFQDFFYLLKDKYKIYRVLKDGLIEIPCYKETFEIFITVNYLAERRK